MRKIEQNMLQAYILMKDWKEDNTEVRVKRWNQNGLPMGVEVLLHGHRIAYRGMQHNGDTVHPSTVDTGTLKVYPTVTTKSRLRALGFNISTKKGVVYLNGKAI